jgi:protein PhnA
MTTPTHCQNCQSENIYNDGNLWVCPECGHEWNPEITPTDVTITDDTSIRDANGQILVDGDSVTVLKDLKIKGSSSVVKGGTKVRNIRLTDGHDGHNIACKIEGLGSINLKSEFVRKV